MSNLLLGKKPENPPAEKEETLPAPAESAVVEHWTSHPLERYRLGDFQFVDGALTLTTEDDIATFNRLHADLPVSEQHRTRKISVADAEALVAASLAERANSTQGIDSASGLRQSTNLVGSGVLGEG